MRYRLLIVSLLLLASACSLPERKARRLERRLLEQIPILFADDILPVAFSPARMDSIRSACASFRKTLDEQLKTAPSGLAADVLQRVGRTLQEYEHRASRLQNDPSFYDIGAYLRSSLALNDPLEKRLEYVAMQLERSPAYYAAARANLRPTNADNIRKAIDIQRNTMLLLQDELPAVIQNSDLRTAEKAALLEAARQCRLDVKNYLAFCRSALFELQNQDLEKARHKDASLSGGK